MKKYLYNILFIMVTLCITVFADDVSAMDSSHFAVLSNNITSAIVLAEDMRVDGNLMVASDLRLNGHSLVVYGNVTLYGRLDISDGSLYVMGDLRQEYNISHSSESCNLNVGSGTLKVEGNYQVISPYSSYTIGFDAGSGRTEIGGNFILAGDNGGASNCEFIMVDDNAYVFVNGDFYLDSSYRYNFDINAGTLEVRGNFHQKSTDAKVNDNFRAAGTHKVILSGNEEQVVFFEDPTICGFNILEIQNQSGELNFQTMVSFKELSGDLSCKGDINIRGTTFSGQSIRGRSLTTRVNEFTQGVKLDLEQDLVISGGSINFGNNHNTINGDVTLNGILNIEDGGLYITGNLRQEYKDSTISCRLNVGSGTLKVEGNYQLFSHYTKSPVIFDAGNGRTEIGGNFMLASEDGNVSNCKFIMLGDNAYILVNGDFYINASDHNFDIDAGILELKGNFMQKGYKFSFQAGGTHTTILSGVGEQIIAFETPSTSYFNILEVRNQSGELDFQTMVNFKELSGDLSCKGDINIRGTTFSGQSIRGRSLTTRVNEFTQGVKLDLEQDLVISGGSINFGNNHNTINGDVTLNGILNIEDGGLYITGNLRQEYKDSTISCRLNVGSGTLKVEGNYQLFSHYTKSPVIFDAGNGRTEIGGNFMLASEDGNVSNCKFIMLGDNAYILVNGDFYINASDHNFDIDAGILELKGNFMQKGYKFSFQAGGTHTTILSGVGEQIIAFETPSTSYFNDIVNKNSDGVRFLSWDEYLEWLANNGNSNLKFTVTFDTVVGEKMKVLVNAHSALSNLPAPTHGEFEFAGWYKEKGYKNRWDTENDRVTENITLYALWKSGEDLEVDQYIIEQVSKYTSDDAMLLMDKILSNDCSDDVKLQVLNEMFQNYGLTNVKEGIQYISETSAHRMNYRYLTTDDIYCAYNFGSWLTNTTKGRFARGLLYSSGLIFNFEKDAYFDILTGTETETPGTQKYKKMLMDFMTASDSGIEVLESAKKTGNFFNRFIKLNNIEIDYRIEDLMKQIIDCSSKSEKESLQKEFATLLLERAGVGKTLSFKSEKFADALGTATDILSFVSSTSEDIIGIINMEEQIELYTKYSDFLKTIYLNPNVAVEMRLAAKHLYDDIESGYYNKFQSILRNCLDFEKNLFNVSLLEGAVKEADLIVNFSSFLINTFFIDVGDFVRQASYTQGYAELSALYSMKLKEDAANFKLSPTAENAWSFFEDYNLLWSLRYKGEEQFLEMSSIRAIMGEIKAFNYTAKENIVRETLNRLCESKFEFTEYEIPKSMQYVSKSVMNCPVNVYVYTQNGDFIAELLDGVECDITNEYGRFAVVYRPYMGEYAKVICQNNDEKLIIKAEAVSDGLLNFETTTVGDTSAYAFDNLHITKGNIIETTDTSTYTIFSNENDEFGTQYMLNKIDYNTYVPIERIMINNKSNITLNMGEKYVLNTTLSPVNATNKMVAWISDNEDILIVENGVITALREGTATIYAYAVDSDNIVDSIEISVAPANLALSQNQVSVNSSIGQLIVTGYKNGQIEKIEFINGYESELSGFGDCEYMKAFLWHTPNTISPLCENKIIYMHPAH